MSQETILEVPEINLPVHNAGSLALRKLTKSYGGPHSTGSAVEDVELEIQSGEFITLLGPSGCGKTTTLRMIAGLESPTSGAVLLDDIDISATPANRRPMSMVFQSYALFPHLTVRENVAYGLRLKKLPAAQIKTEVDAALATMSLSGYGDRGAHQLSGGQQQRVALARALVMKPKVLLFDEPLSNLDAKLRVQMRGQIRRLQQRLGITSVFVTHDQDEAMTMSDRVVVMRGGRIQQVASPEEIYRRPASMFVADFIGTANFLSADVLSVRPDGTALVEALRQKLEVAAHRDITSSTEAFLLVRPESLRLKPVDTNDLLVKGNHGRVLSCVFHGERVEYEIESETGNIVVSLSDPGLRTLAIGEGVEISFDADRAWLLPSEEL